MDKSLELLSRAGLAVLLLSMPAGMLRAAVPKPQAAGSGHACRQAEDTAFDYDATRDRLCRSEQDHICRCRRALRRLPSEAGRQADTTGAYYDASRDLCLDDWTHFQCLEKGGDWLCRAPGRCLCDNKPRRCAKADLGNWKDYACGSGNCEGTRLLRGREPKPGVWCRGGNRWDCVPSESCPKAGKVCGEADFDPWRAVGCAVRGCRAGQMAWLRKRKTYLECPEAMAFQCKPDPACSPD